MTELALKYWIKARYAIYINRQAGRPKPWTDDLILRRFRFCNVHRENDTVTQWIRKWAAPHDRDPSLWFAFVVARLVNNPTTLAEMFKFPIPWGHSDFVETIRKVRRAGVKAYSSAYIVSTNGRKMEKASYLAEQVLEPLWKARASMEGALTCEQLYASLRAFNGMGTFMAAQVVADTKFHSQLRQAPDWWTFAAPGPGSHRGLNRVQGMDKDTPRTEHKWLAGLAWLQNIINPWAEKHHIPRISAQDLQNCLCEFDKYERVRLGEGTPRNSYPGA